MQSNSANSYLSHCVILDQLSPRPVRFCIFMGYLSLPCNLRALSKRNVKGAVLNDKDLLET